MSAGDARSSRPGRDTLPGDDDDSSEEELDPPATADADEARPDEARPDYRTVPGGIPAAQLLGISSRATLGGAGPYVASPFARPPAASPPAASPPAAPPPAASPPAALSPAAPLPPRRAPQPDTRGADRSGVPSAAPSSEEGPISVDGAASDSIDEPLTTAGAGASGSYTFDPYEEDSDPFGSLATGAKLGGRYRLEKILGKGATGVVFAASHLVIGKRVAVKCLYPHHRATPNAVERFFREARIAATVEHPNVIQVFDGGDEKDTLFLAMELLEGEPLGDRIDRGPMPLAETVRIFLQIMSGVAAVHERGVVHRDLKPDNVFLCSSRFQKRILPKVLDFGISKLKDPGSRELTSLGTVMGTPFYMAPEQVTNTRDVDVRADVYSLGVMMYEALAGDVPYYGETVIEIFRAAQAGGAPPLHELRNDVSSSLAEVIAKAMAQDRDHRYESVADFAAALTALELDVTDAEHTNPPVPDVRATVRDLPSPLLDVATVPGRAGEALGATLGMVVPPTPAAVDVLGLRAEEKRTVALARPHIIERTPTWVYYALASAAGLTLASVILAVLALIL